MDVSTEWCRSKYGQPNLHVLATCERELEEVQHGKPAPDFFLEAARRLGVPRADCVVFEDSEEALKGTRRAGMRTVGVIGSAS